MNRAKEEGRELMQALLTGVSYMIPFVVAGGILIALGFAFGGIYGWHETKSYFSWISCAVSDVIGACRSGSPWKKQPS